jgi:GTP cyclohydrolase II
VFDRQMPKKRFLRSLKNALRHLRRPENNPMERSGPGSLRQVAATALPTSWGAFSALGFERPDLSRGRLETAIVLILGNPFGAPLRRAPLVRLHSECLTGDALRSLRCDCGEQLELALRAIAEEGCGLLIYEQQEGRGIGLMAKLQAYALQDQGLDTVAANRALGFEADCRDFSLPAAILNHLGIGHVRLLSNNPEKHRALARAGIVVVEKIPCEASPSPWALKYLKTKKERMGHTLSKV